MPFKCNLQRYILDGTGVFESGAIMLYIADLAAGPHTFANPVDPIA